MAEVEDRNLVFPVERTKMANQEHLKISYTRDFLLSFSNMDICKRPPNGFDLSFLSDCQYTEVVQSAPEWRRACGTSSIQSSKHAGNGLQATTWVESSSRSFHDKAARQSFGPSSHGRWENHPGSGEESGDQESEKGSINQDSSRRSDSQSQQLGQSPERDGLLGSGGFPRPSIHAGGPLKGQRNGGQHLSRSTDRYQPPWMNKPSYQARRDATDLCNDETFGSSKCPSQDKADEERRRRASFEIMRKEQQKALQEKLKQAPNKQNTDLSSLDMSGNQISWQSDNGADGHAGLHRTDQLKSSLPQASAARPLVPPGFANTKLDKNLAAKAPMPSEESEHDKSMPVQCLQSTNASMLTNDTVLDQIQEKYLAADLEVCNEHLKFEVGGSSSTNGIEKPMDTCLGPTNDSIPEFDPNKWIEMKTGVSQENSNSILEKLFGGAVKADTAGLTAVSESPVEKPNEEPWDPTNQSSKFSHWFAEEEAKSSVDKQPYKAESLLSLFVNAEKGMSQGQKNAATTFPPEVGNVHEFLQDPLIRNAGSTASDVDKLDVRSSVLTCEHLEQFILAEANASHGSVSLPTKESVITYDSGTTHQKTDVDDRASQHLLSLLQKGSFLSETTAPTKNDSVAVPVALPDAVEGLQLPQKTLTLETLFGTAFMQELQSAEAPVSVQGISGKGAVRYADDASDPILISTGFDKFGPSKSSHDISTMLYHGLTKKTDTNNNTSWVDVDGSKESTRPNVSGVFGFESEHAAAVAGIHLPEEDSLISIGNHPPIEALKFARSTSSSKENDFLSDDIIDKFAVLSNTPKGNRSVTTHVNHQPLQEVLRGPFDTAGPAIQYQQHLFDGRPMHHLNMNPSKPMHLQLERDPNRNLETFMGLGSSNPGHDLRHPFAPNVLPHPFHHIAGMPPRLDHPQHPSIQHMIPNNFPGSQPLAPLPTGMALPPHLQGMGVFNNPMAALLPELHSFQGPSFHQRPSHFNSMEMSFPVGRPEGLERLIEMELRANANRKPPMVHNAGPLGPELDMAYRYR